MSNRKPRPDLRDHEAPSISRREFVAWTGGTILVGVLTGCGGGSSSPALAGKGRVQLRIAWPQQPSGSPPAAGKETRGASRYIPTYAASLYFELYKQETPNDRLSLVVNRPDDRPSSQTVEFLGLIPVGTYVLAGVARVQAGGQGATVASAATMVEIQAGKTATAELTLNSTVRSLEIQGQPLSVQAGKSLTLLGRALDPDGKVILLPGDALKWTLVSGAAFADLTPVGLFTAKAAGTARVRLAEEGANVTVEADVAVTAGGGGVITLANTPWPKARGDLGNTAQAKGQGATGVVKWELPLSQGVGNRGLKAGYLIGLDGTIIVGATGGIYGIDPATGAERWQNKTVKMAVGTIPLLAADGRLFLVEQSPRSQFGAGPTVVDSANGNILLRTGLLNKKGDVALGPDGTLYSFSSSSGNNFLHAETLAGDQITERWKIPASAERLALSLDNRLFLVQQTGATISLNALDGAAGAVIWQYNSQTLSFFAQPAFGANGMVYFGVNNRFFAINASGQKVWEYDGVGYATSPAIGPDGTVYVEIGSMLYALDGNTGTPIWQYAMPSNGPAGDASREPVIGPDGTVYIGADTSLFALEQYVENGTKKVRLKWKLTLPHSLVISRNPIMLGADGTVYVAGSVYSGALNDTLFAIG